MANLLIQDENLAWQLLDIAQRENRSVESVLKTLLADYRHEEHTEGSQDEPQPGTFAALAKSAQEAGINSGPTDIGKRSREILDTEFTDDLIGNLKRPSNDTK